MDLTGKGFSRPRTGREGAVGSLYRQHAAEMQVVRTLDEFETLLPKMFYEVGKKHIDERKKILAADPDFVTFSQKINETRARETVDTIDLTHVSKYLLQTAASPKILTVYNEDLVPLKFFGALMAQEPLNLMMIKPDTVRFLIRTLKIAPSLQDFWKTHHSDKAHAILWSADPSLLKHLHEQGVFDQLSSVHTETAGSRTVECLSNLNNCSESSFNKLVAKALSGNEAKGEDYAMFIEQPVLGKLFDKLSRIEEEQSKQVDFLLEMEILTPQISTDRDTGDDAYGGWFPTGFEHIQRILLYEERWVAKGWSAEDYEEFHPLLTQTTGAVEHPQEWSEEVRAFETEGVDLRQGPFEERFQRLCNAAYDKAREKSTMLQQLQTSSAEERERNIHTVNIAQERFLKGVTNTKAEFQESLAEFPESLKDLRSVIMYFKEEDNPRMDAFAFAVMCWAVQHYVSEGYSRLFNNINVVSRMPQKYPHFVHKIGIPKQNYLDVTGDDFLDTLIGGNMIHATHGSVYDNVYGSIPILGTGTRNSNVRMHDVNRYVPLPLYFYKDNRESDKDRGLENIPEEDKSRSIADIIQVTTEALIELEKKCIEHAEDQNRQYV